MNKFKLIIKYGSGYKGYICNRCGNYVAIPQDDKRKVIWCYYCDNTEAKNNE